MVEIIDMQTGQLFLFPANQDRDRAGDEKAPEGTGNSVTLMVTRAPYLKVTTLTGTRCLVAKGQVAL